MHQVCCIMLRSPFAAKLGIGPRDAPHQSQGVELSRTTSLRHYGAIKDAESADVEDHQLWSAVRSSCPVPLERMLLESDQLPHRLPPGCSEMHSAVIIGCDLHSTPLRLCSALRHMGSVDRGDVQTCLVVTCQGTLHLQQQGLRRSRISETHADTTRSVKNFAQRPSRLRDCWWAIWPSRDDAACRPRSWRRRASACCGMSTCPAAT